MPNAHRFYVIFAVDFTAETRESSIVDMISKQFSHIFPPEILVRCWYHVAWLKWSAT